MKKGTRTWKLEAMVVVYCFSIIGVAGVYSRYFFFNVYMNEIILFLATITTMCIIAVFVFQLVNLLTKILKRKR
jgi:hypothetical protein